MNWDAIGAIGEILGAVAVFISLVYLATQIRSNTTQLKFDARQAVANSGDRGFDPIYAEPSMSIWVKGHGDYENLTEGERMIFGALMVRQLHNFQNLVIARRESLIDEDTFIQTYVGFYRPLVKTAGGSAWFGEGKSLLISEVVEILSRDD